MAGTNYERSYNMPIFILLHSLEITVGESGDYYWAWTASVAGLVLHILAVVHTVLWGLPSLIVGSLVCCVYKHALVFNAPLCVGCW